MGRPRRFALPGVFHHVTVQLTAFFFHPRVDPDGGADVSVDEAACEILMEAIREAKRKRPFYLYAFVIMGNHYHMVIGIPRGARQGWISEILHAIHNPFAKRLNRHLGRRGPVVIDRPRTPVIENIHYLARAINYVHCNPSRCAAGLDPRRYRYSSLRTVMSGGQEGWYRELLDQDPSELLVTGFEAATAVWLRHRTSSLLVDNLRGVEDNLKTSMCTLVVGDPIFLRGTRLAVGLRPLRRGRWAVPPGGG